MNWLCKDCDYTQQVVRQKKTTNTISPIITHSPTASRTPTQTQSTASADRFDEIMEKLSTVITQNKTLEESVSSLREEMRKQMETMSGKISVLESENEKMRRHIENMNFRTDTVE